MYLRERLGKTFTLTAELDPPRGCDPSKLLNEARAAQCYVDAVNISDSPQANLRMNPLVAAHLVQTSLGLEVIAHFTCRDRNVLGLQSELLGAAALGVRNILCLRGDPPSIGDHPQAKGVFEVDAVGLTRIVRELNRGKSLAGRDLEPSDFAVAVAANPGAPDLDLERQRLSEKVAAGAHFAQTQPVFELAVVQRFNDVVQPSIPVLFGVLPVLSLEMAQRVSKWTSIPQALLTALETGGRDAGIAWARRIVQELRDAGVAGAHIYPLGRSKVLAEVLRES
ncbi:MAG: methylenetetrahydrofolate reductase [Deinococcales bacterium]